jgi:hypothetical protein
VEYTASEPLFFLVAAGKRFRDDLGMSTAQLQRIVDEATEEEQQFLFVGLSERLYAHRQEELEELDRRMAELDAGKKRLSLEEFEKRLDQPNQG